MVFANFICFIYYMKSFIRNVIKWPQFM